MGEPKYNIKRNHLMIIIILVIAIFFITYFWSDLTAFFSNSQRIRDFVVGFGMLAPLIFVCLVIAQIIVSPIPGTTSGIVGGYIFGIFLGGFYAAIGTIIGHMLAFGLARKFGIPLVRRMVDAKKFKKFDKIIRKNMFVVFLIYLLPGFPDDTVSYIVGLTKLKTKIMLLMATVGALGSFVTAFLGNSMAEYNPFIAVLIFGAIIIISLMGYISREKIERQMLKLIYKIEGVKK